MIQSHSPSSLGYVPQSVLQRPKAKSPNSLPQILNPSHLKLLQPQKPIICQRCHGITHHNHLCLPFTMEPEKLLSKVNFDKCTMCVVVDSLDIASSRAMIHAFKQFIIGKKLMIVGTKLSLLPKELANPSKIKAQILNDFKSLIDGNFIGVFIVDSVDGTGIESLKKRMLSIEKLAMICLTNAGNSQLLNAISRQNPKESLVTTSWIPGTTVGMITKKLEYKSHVLEIMDTPGLLNPNQLIHYMDIHDLSLAVPTKQIKARKYYLESGKSLFTRITLLLL